MPTDRLIAQRVLVRDLADRSRIVATLRVDQIGGNAHPHFSATASVYDAHGTHSGASRQRRGLEWDAGGCVHDDILAAFPGAASFVALHLSDWPSGEPMHAEANGRYFIECGRFDAAASTLRVSVSDLPPADRAAVAAFVDAQRPRWAQEAADAMALLERMPDATDLRGYDGRGQAIPRLPLPGWLIGSDVDELVEV